MPGSVGSRGLVALLPLLVATAAAADRPPGAVFRDCPQCPAMVVVPRGHFEMGSDDAAAGNGDETPRHRVTFSRPFALGRHEVTRAEFSRFVAATGIDTGDDCNVLVDGDWATTPGRRWDDPGFPQGGDEPVVCVDWLVARAYARWLSRETGQRYRLPSEAEWEYVARRGGLAESITHEVANYGSEACCAGAEQGSDRWLHTAPVGSFRADASGLHDVLGNVWEWLEDCYHGSYDGAPADGGARISGCADPTRRVVRGGGYGDGAWLLRAGYRLRGPLDGRYATLGFRVARSLD